MVQATWMRRIRGNTFPKSERLTSKEAFDHIFSKGESLRSGPFRIRFAFIDKEESAIKTAFAVPKRLQKRAVDRNSIKRRMREAYRLNRHPLYERLLEKGVTLGMIIVYTSPTVPDSSEVREKIMLLLKRLEEEVFPTSKKNTNEED